MGLVVHIDMGYPILASTAGSSLKVLDDVVYARGPGPKNIHYSRGRMWSRVGRGRVLGYLGLNVHSGSRATPHRASENGSRQSAEYGKVHILFKVHKCCEFGRRVGVVGNLTGLGAWTSSQALALEWNDGHIWSGSITVPLEEILQKNDSSPSRASLEYKYIVQSSVDPCDESQVEWMPGDNLHIPAMEYGTTALSVQDTWGFGYREIQFERMAEETMKEMIVQEEMDTRKAMDSMAKKALGELSSTLSYCESLLYSGSHEDPCNNILIDADRELAASSDRATRMLRANQALFYMDGV